MRQGDIQIGDRILIKYKYAGYYNRDPFEARVTKLAGDRFQIKCWNPFSRYWHQWLEMEDYVLIGQVRYGR